MVRILSSPSARRRLWFLAAVLIAVGAAAALVVLIPERTPQNSSPTGSTPAQLTPRTSEKVSAEARRAIDATLDRFIPAGVGRRSMNTAWKLAGPEMKADTSLRQWRAGTSPIPYYPVQGTSFHGWTTVDSGPDFVEFNLLLHPRPGKGLAPWVFSGQMVRHNSHWLVNRLYTIAILRPVGASHKREVGPADYAGSPPATEPATGKPLLGKGWLLVAAGGVTLPLLILLGFLATSALRSRRLRRQYAMTAGHRQDLPPLPARRS